MKSQNEGAVSVKIAPLLFSQPHKKNQSIRLRFQDEIQLQFKCNRLYICIDVYTYACKCVNYIFIYIHIHM